MALCWSCDTGENSVISTGYIRLSAAQMPDTVYIDSVTNVAQMNLCLQCSAENLCWSNLQFIDSQLNDSTYAFAAIGVYENHGQTCAEAIISADTTLVRTYTASASVMRADTVAPFFTKRLFCKYYSLGELYRTDTVVAASYRLK